MSREKDVGDDLDILLDQMRRSGRWHDDEFIPDTIPLKEKTKRRQKRDDGEDNA